MGSATICGIGYEWERLLSAAFISSGEYGTRSGEPGEEVRFEFALIA
jgi:hypothetical protein